MRHAEELLLQPMPCSLTRETRVEVEGVTYWVRFWHHGDLTICSIVWQGKKGLVRHTHGSTCRHPKDTYDQLVGERQAARRACQIGAPDPDWMIYRLGAQRHAVWQAIRCWLFEERAEQIMRRVRPRKRITMEQAEALAELVQRS